MKRSTPNYLSRIVETANRTAPAAKPPAMASPALPDTLPHESFPLDIHDARPPIQKPAECTSESINLPQRTQPTSPHPVIPITPAGRLVGRQIHDRHSTATTTGTRGGTADSGRSSKTFSPPLASAAASRENKPATPTASAGAKGIIHSGRE